MISRPASSKQNNDALNKVFQTKVIGAKLAECLIDLKAHQRYVESDTVVPLTDCLSICLIISLSATSQARPEKCGYVKGGS